MRHPRTLLVAAAVLALLLAVTIRVGVSSQRELEAGLSAKAEGRLPAAQEHFLRSARWYLPLMSSCVQAVEELLALGEGYIEAADHPRAVAAFDDARGALWATAWLAGPDAQLLARADDGYARSLAQWKHERDPRTVVDDDAVRYRQVAASVPVQNPWWMLVMGLSFAGYVAILARLAWKWDDGIRKLPLVAAAAGCFAVWVVSMLLI